jgi:hypothetical protein
MNRKLLLLDAVLLAVIAYAGIQLRNERRAALAREAARLNHQVTPAPTPAYNPPLPEPPVLSAGYAAIAQKLLFDKSRNPDVVIEVVPPPPPRPMPALPVYHGMMTIGHSGPTAFLSLTKDSPHKAIHPGEQIGQFTLVDVNSTEMTLEWEGQQIHKRVEELAAIASTAPVEEPTAAPAAAATPAAPPRPTLTGPGEQTQFGYICAVNDGHADGEIVDGKKKIVRQTPFGTSCIYEAVK